MGIKRLIGAKGLFFTIDSFIALSIIIIVVLVATSYYTYQKPETNIVDLSYDILQSLSNINVGEIENDKIKDLIATGVITKVNNTVVEQIAEFWALDRINLSKNITRDIIEELVPKQFGVSLVIDGEEVYIRNKSIEASLVSSMKIISGITRDKPIDGYTSRALLTKISNKTVTKIYEFDVSAPCYRAGSSANRASIEYPLVLPDDAVILDATWWIVNAMANRRVEAYVNDNLIFEGVPPKQGIKDLEGYFNPGLNIIRYNTSGSCPGDDGTSHLVLTFTTNQASTLDQEITDDNKLLQEFPFQIVYTNGRMSDYEKWIFAPNLDIEKMNISINLNASSVSLLFRYKGVEQNFGTKVVTKSYVEWTDDEIKNSLQSEFGLQYSDLKDTYFTFIFDINPFNSNVTILPNSSVILVGTNKEVPFGVIDLSEEIEMVATQGSAACNGVDNITWNFNVPDSNNHLYANWIIGWCAPFHAGTQEVDQIATSNGVDLYRHTIGDPDSDPFIYQFGRFGFTKNVKSGSIIDGLNDFILYMGDNYALIPPRAYGINAFYVTNSISYKTISKKAEGCLWTVDLANGEQINMKIPKNYSDSSTCEYTNSQIVYDADDALQSVGFELFSMLDIDGDGDIDIIIDEETVEVETNTVSEVPSLWGPARVEVRVWQ